MNAAAAALETLALRTADEIAALDAGDLDALAAATRAKLAALAPLADRDPEALAAEVPRARIVAAAELNRDAARRVNFARAVLDRRMYALLRATGRAPVAAYGPDGRLATRVLRP